jgi:hypothetical protein
MKEDTCKLQLIFLRERMTFRKSAFMELKQLTIFNRSLLQFRMNAGGGQVIARFNQPLPLSTWHKIDVKRNDRAVTMTLNNVLETTGVLSPGFTVLDFQGQMFIGSPSTPVGR